MKNRLGFGVIFHTTLLLHFTAANWLENNILGPTCSRVPVEYTNIPEYRNVIARCDREQHFCRPLCILSKLGMIDNEGHFMSGKAGAQLQRLLPPNRMSTKAFELTGAFKACSVSFNFNEPLSVGRGCSSYSALLNCFRKSSILICEGRRGREILRESANTPWPAAFIPSYIYGPPSNFQPSQVGYPQNQIYGRTLPPPSYQNQGQHMPPQYHIQYGNGQRIIIPPSQGYRPSGAFNAGPHQQRYGPQPQQIQNIQPNSQYYAPIQGQGQRRPTLPVPQNDRTFRPNVNWQNQQLQQQRSQQLQPLNNPPINQGRYLQNNNINPQHLPVGGSYPQQNQNYPIQNYNQRPPPNYNGRSFNPVPQNVGGQSINLIRRPQQHPWTQNNRQVVPYQRLPQQSMPPVNAGKGYGQRPGPQYNVQQPQQYQNGPLNIRNNPQQFRSGPSPPNKIPQNYGQQIPLQSGTINTNNNPQQFQQFRPPNNPQNYVPQPPLHSGPLNTDNKNGRENHHQRPEIPTPKPEMHPRHQQLEMPQPAISHAPQQEEVPKIPKHHHEISQGPQGSNPQQQNQPDIPPPQPELPQKQEMPQHPQRPEMPKLPHISGGHKIPESNHQGHPDISKHPQLQKNPHHQSHPDAQAHHAAAAAAHKERVEGMVKAAQSEGSNGPILPPDHPAHKKIQQINNAGNDQSGAGVHPHEIHKQAQTASAFMDSVHAAAANEAISKNSQKQQSGNPNENSGNGNDHPNAAAHHADKKSKQISH